MNVYISAVAHPYAFWIQVVNEEATLLDKQIDKLNEYYAKNINCSFVCIILFKQFKIKPRMSTTLNKGFRSKKFVQNLNRSLLIQ